MVNRLNLQEAILAAANVRITSKDADGFGLASSILLSSGKKLRDEQAKHNPLLDDEQREDAAIIKKVVQELVGMRVEDAIHFIRSLLTRDFRPTPQDAMATDSGTKELIINIEDVVLAIGCSTIEKMFGVGYDELFEGLLGYFDEKNAASN